MALRTGNERTGNSLLMIPVAKNTEILEGIMVAINAKGLAVPASKFEGLIVAGRSEQYVNNSTTTDGAIGVRVKRGVFVYNNSSAGAIKEIDILKKCYIEDSETVTITATGSSVAGKILEVTEDGSVTIEIYN